MTTPHPAWRAWTAVAAAYLLVLQVLVTGITGGAHAAPLGLDAGAPILCTPSAHGGTVPPKDGAPSPHKNQPCCVLGCPMFGPAAAPPPAFWSHVRPPAPVMASILPVWPGTLGRSVHGFSPVHPRAPPGAV